MFKNLNPKISREQLCQKLWVESQLLYSIMSKLPV